MQWTSLSRFEKLLAPFLCFVGAALLLKGFWTPSVFLAGSDTFSHDYLMWQWGWETFLREGALPWWNPWLFGGFPFIGSFAFCPFYPPAWLSVPLPTSLAITAQYGLHFALGAWGFYAWGRSMGWSRMPALAAGLLFLMGAHAPSLAFPGHLAKVQALAWVGWSLAAAGRLETTGRLRWGVTLGACWALQLLASHAQVFYGTFWLTFLFLIFQTLRKREKLLPVGAGLALAVGVAALLSAAQMLPAWQIARQSNRGGGVPIAEAEFGGLPPVEALEIFLPSLLGDSTGRAFNPGGKEAPTVYLGRWHGRKDPAGAQRLVSDYAGIWTFVFVVLGIFLSRRQERWFFLGIFLLALGVAFGEWFFLFRWLHGWLPGFDRFRSPATYLFVCAFCWFTLAGLGLEAAWQKRDWLRSRGARCGLATLLAALVLLVLAVVCFSTFAQLGRTAQEEQAPVMLRWAYVLRSVGWALFFGGLGGLIGAVALGTRKRRIRRVAGILFLVVILADGYLHVRRFFPKDETRRLEHYLSGYPADSLVTRDARGQALPTCVPEGNALTNRLMMRDVRSLHGYHPIQYAGYNRLLRAASPPEPRWRLFAVNYRMAPRMAQASSDWRLLGRASGRSVLTRRERAALARVPLEVRALGVAWEVLPEEEWKHRLGARHFDPAVLSWCEGHYSWQMPALQAADAKDAFAVQTRREKAGRFVFRWAHRAQGAELRKAAAVTGVIPVVVSIPAGRGWQVEGPARENWPKRANGFLLLIPLSPEGEAETTLTYVPPSGRWGTGLSLGGLVGLLAAGLVLQRRNMQSP